MVMRKAEVGRMSQIRNIKTPLEPSLNSVPNSHSHFLAEHTHEAGPRSLCCDRFLFHMCILA